jgi:predicted  nucleic acid-binding Zn-ribbon protein
MSSVYNPESELMAEIERLELETRDIRRRIEHARSEEDKRVLNRQLDELKQQIEALQARLPKPPAQA